MRSVLTCRTRAPGLVPPVLNASISTGVDGPLQVLDSATARAAFIPESIAQLTILIDRTSLIALRWSFPQPPYDGSAVKSFSVRSKTVVGVEPSGDDRDLFIAADRPLKHPAIRQPLATHTAFWHGSSRQYCCCHLRTIGHSQLLLDTVRAARRPVFSGRLVCRRCSSRS